MSEHDSWDTVPLANPEDLSDDERFKGLKLQMDAGTGKAQYAGDTGSEIASASLAGPTPKYATHSSERTGMMGTQMASTKVLPPGTKAEPLHPHDKPMSHEQLMAKAQKMLQEQQEQGEAQLANPALSERDAAGGMLPAWLVKQGY